VIPNFIDCDKYRRTPVADLRASLAPRGEKLLIHVSNFRPVKRVDVAMEVFARVRAQVPARLVLVGDGPDLGKVQRLASALGVADAVVVLGEQDPVMPLLSVADVFLLPSAQESFGLAALEAMACGVPVVASRVGGLSEVVDDGVSGCLHEADDVDGNGAVGRHAADRRGRARAHGVRCRTLRARPFLRHQNRADVRVLLRKNNGRSGKWIALTLRDRRPVPRPIQVDNSLYTRPHAQENSVFLTDVCAGRSPRIRAVTGRQRRD
jgi:glycosyltransferase involved in cell wall biosynthesis